MIPASRLKRFLAYICDGIIGCLIVILVGFSVALGWSILNFSMLKGLENFKFSVFVVMTQFMRNQSFIAVFMSVAICCIALFFTIYESSRYQATPGKRLCDLYVGTSNNKRLSFKRALWRYILFILPGILSVVLGLIVALIYKPIDEIMNILIYVLTAIWFGPILSVNRLGVHDMLSKTVVLARK